MVDDVLEELENGYVMDQPDACPDGVYELMCKCWEMEPADRPSFQSLQLLLQQSFSHGTCAFLTLPALPSVCYFSPTSPMYLPTVVSDPILLFFDDVSFICLPMHTGEKAPVPTPPVKLSIVPQGTALLWCTLYRNGEQAVVCLNGVGQAKACIAAYLVTMLQLGLRIHLTTVMTVHKIHRLLAFETEH